MLDLAIQINKSHIKRDELSHKIYRKFNERNKKLHEYYDNSKQYYGRRIYDDSVSLYFLLTSLYLERISRRSIKKLNIEIDDNNFENAQNNLNRVELINKVLDHMDKQGVKTKLKVSPLYNYNRQETQNLFTYKITIETLF